MHNCSKLKEMLEWDKEMLNMMAWVKPWIHNLLYLTYGDKTIIELVGIN